MRTTARTAAFIPGASPPLVSTATFIFIGPLTDMYTIAIASDAELEENVGVQSRRV